MRKRYDDIDDGHTIADMSELRGSLTGSPREASSRGPLGLGGMANLLGGSHRDVREELGTPEERMMVILGTLKAALSIGMVYVVAFGILIAILVAVWT